MAALMQHAPPGERLRVAEGTGASGSAPAGTSASGVTPGPTPVSGARPLQPNVKQPTAVVRADAGTPDAPLVVVSPAGEGDALPDTGPGTVGSPVPIAMKASLPLPAGPSPKSGAELVMPSDVLLQGVELDVGVAGL